VRRVRRVNGEWWVVNSEWWVVGGGVNSRWHRLATGLVVREEGKWWVVGGRWWVEKADRCRLMADN
jgi:hypothetical protein